MRSIVSLTVFGLPTLLQRAAAARGTIAALWRHYPCRHGNRIAAARLHAMDDGMLKDIGLCRGEIEFALSGVGDPTRIPRGHRGRLADVTTRRATAPLVLRSALLAAATPLLLLAAEPAQALGVTYVSAAVPGSSSCGTFANPCRSFENAINQTDPGGTIVVLTSGDYSGAHINKSLTITATGVNAIVKYCTNVGAFGVELDPGEQVTLRGLTMDCRASGTAGLYFGAAGSLLVQNSLIQGYYGINVPATGVGDVHIADTTIADSGHVGPLAPALNLQGQASITLDRVRFVNNNNGVLMQGRGRLVMRDSVISGTVDAGITVTRGRAFIERTAVTDGQVAIRAAGNNSVVHLSNSTITGNASGLVAEGGGRIISFENNVVRGNGRDGAPTGVEGYR